VKLCPITYRNYGNNLSQFIWSGFQWRNEGGQRGQLHPSAAGKGAQNSLTENSLMTNGHKSEFDIVYE